MTNRLTIILFVTGFSLNLFGQISQTEKDSLKKVRDANRRQYQEEYRRTVKDSIEFVGQLIDLNFGTSCGISPGAGTFIFKVVKTDRKGLSDTVAVIIQCARGPYYEKILIQNNSYKIKMTPNHLKGDVDFIWDKYKNVTRYFLMHDKPTIVK